MRRFDYRHAALVPLAGLFSLPFLAVRARPPMPSGMDKKGVILAEANKNKGLTGYKYIVCLQDAGILSCKGLTKPPQSSLMPPDFDCNRTGSGLFC